VAIQVSAEAIAPGSVDPAGDPKGVDWIVDWIVDWATVGGRSVRPAIANRVRMNRLIYLLMMFNTLSIDDTTSSPALSWDAVGDLLNDRWIRPGFP
jgi:hypothetical protein